MKVVVQKWEESERGWGTRPDGYSIHKTDADRQEFINAHYEWMHKTYGDHAPDEYSRPDGTPYEAEVEGAEGLLAGKKGHRIHDSNYPGKGGTDGWRAPR